MVKKVEKVFNFSPFLLLFFNGKLFYILEKKINKKVLKSLTTSKS